MAYGNQYGATSLLQFLESYSLTDVILPFFIVFLVVFAILQKSHLLGQNKKNFNAMFALIMGLMVVMPHVLGKYPPGKDLVVILNEVLPNVSVLAIAIMMLLLIIGIVAPHYAGSNFTGVVALFAFAGIVYFFGAAGNWWPAVYNNWWGPDTTSLVIVILVFALILWFILREPGQGEPTAALARNLEGLTNFFGGRGGGGGGHH